MSYTPQEQAILKKFKIDNFRQLKKENIVELTSMLDKVEPEVAMKIIAQFPEFAKTSLEVVKDFQVMVTKAIDSNEGTQKVVFEACQRKLDILEQLLQKEQLSLDDQKIYFTEWDKVIAELKSLDETNKKWLGDLILTVGKFSLYALGIGAVILGGPNILKRLEK